MVDDGLYTTNASIVAKAGINASSTSAAVGETDKYVRQVEAFINVTTRRNWSDDYSGLNDDVKQIVLGISSSLCAILVITNDMSGFTSRSEAQSMIDVLRDDALRSLSVLRIKASETFIDSE